MLVRLPDMPSVVHLSALPVSFSLPSNSAILVALFTALLLLVVVHAAYVLVREHVRRAKSHFDQKKVSLVAREQGVPPPPVKPQQEKVERTLVTASALEQQSRMPEQGKRGNGLFSWFKWGNALPLSLSARRVDVVKDRSSPASPSPSMSQISQLCIAAPPRSEASQNPSQAPQLHRGQSWSQVRRPGPAFETPLPALYQTEVPASMAKIIMSRHTYRKPTIRPPSRSPSPSPQMQISKRPPSLV